MITWQGLIRFPGVLLDPVLARDWAATLASSARPARVLHGADAPITYLRIPLHGPMPAATLADWADAARAMRGDAEVALLRGTTDLPGASAGQPAAWHYIVETDVAQEVESELDAWYETEHLPGLAAVPGTVRAQRFIDETGSPRHHACYDLNTREAFGSPPWLAVRATAWSDQVRPHFRHTRRTMFRVVA